MPFTDETLADLKAGLNRIWPKNQVKQVTILAPAAEALVERLKAAENCLKIAQEMLGSNLWQEKVWQEYLNIWREKR